MPRQHCPQTVRVVIFAAVLISYGGAALLFLLAASLMKWVEAGISALPLLRPRSLPPSRTVQDGGQGRREAAAGQAGVDALPLAILGCAAPSTAPAPRPERVGHSLSSGPRQPTGAQAGIELT